MQTVILLSSVACLCVVLMLCWMRPKAGRPETRTFSNDEMCQHFKVQAAMGAPMVVDLPAPRPKRSRPRKMEPSAPSAAPECKPAHLRETKPNPRKRERKG